MNEAETIDLQLLVRQVLHDLEKPLLAAGRVWDHLEAGRIDPAQPRHRRLIQSAALANRRSRRLITDLNDILSHRRLPVRWTVVSLRELAGEIAAAFDTAAQVEACRFEWGCEGDAEIRTDPGLVARVAENFLYNALNHTTPDGMIRLSVRAAGAGQTTVFSVENEGEGIPESLLPAIFDTGVQIESRSRRLWRGFGLGLTFCKMAARSLGGSVLAENRTRPEGMRFSLMLPGA